MVSKVFSILNFVKKQMMKTDKDGIMRLPGELKSKYGEAVIIRQLVEAGVDPRTIKNEQQLIGILDSIDAMKARRTTKPGTTGIMGTKEAGVFDLKGNRLDPNKKITGGTQETEDMIKQKLEEQNKKAVKDFKKKMEDTEDKADGGRIGFFTAGLAAGDEISPGTASKQEGNGPTRRDQDLRDLATKQAEDKKEELVEKFRNKQMQDSNLPGLLGMATKFLKKPLQAGMTGTRNFVLNKVIDAKRGMFKDIDFYSLTPKEQENLMDEYMSARMDNTIDAYGNPIGGGGRDDPFIPINQMSTNMNQPNMHQAST